MGSSPISGTMKKLKVVAIVGPTASGKTSLSITIAQAFAGEVISADSRQIYIGMDIGTAKVTMEEMQGVPHHLIDLLHPNQIYTATNFKRDAADAITAITARGHLPIIAGGSFFYLDMLLGRMRPAPVAPNPALRKQLETLSTETLFAQLKVKDAVRAKKIDEHNRRRLIRSLEIIETLGHVPEVTTDESPYDVLTIGVTAEKETLRNNYEKRIIKWLNVGFIDEVDTLLSDGVSKERLAEMGFEYSLALLFKDGTYSEADFIQKFIEKNWQYAKRQMTWLKRDDTIEWFLPENRTAIVERVRTFLQQT